MTSLDALIAFLAIAIGLLLWSIDRRVEAHAERLHDLERGLPWNATARLEDLEADRDAHHERLEALEDPENT